MKKQLERMIQLALRRLLDQHEIVAMPAFIQIEASKERKYGDFSTNIALILAKTSHHPPTIIAERIVAEIPHSTLVAKIEIQKPGFINFFLTPHAYQNLLAAILTEKENYGRTKIGRAKKVLVEFVSASPIKPLNQNHARLAVLGKVITNLLDTIGFQVATEFYVDDVGLSIQIFTVEVWREYLKLQSEKPSESPSFAHEVAIILFQRVGDQFVPNENDIKQVFSSFSLEEVIANSKSILANNFDLLQEYIIHIVTELHQHDLAELDISFDYWTDAKVLMDVKKVDQVIERLAAKELLYKKDGSTWFHSLQFADERDRVLIKPDGEYTHLAHDLAYHLNKFERGFDLAVDIFDFNPLDYSSGIQAGLQALGYDPEQLMALFVQPVEITRDGETISLPLGMLQEIYPRDELYFQMLIKRASQPIEFDFNAESINDHPLSYIQYAAVRIKKVFNELKVRDIPFNEKEGLSYLELLILPEERMLLNVLDQYADTLVYAALQYEPHLLVHYLRTLAALFHAYYNACTFLVDDKNVRAARLTLISSVSQLLINGCALLGISLPETM